MPSVSKAQQQAAAIAKHHPEKAKGAAKKMAKSMSKSQLHDFAATKRKKLPKHVQKKASSNPHVKESPMFNQMFLQGYLAKEAAEYDLPGGEWYKGLLADLTTHQAGRAQALGRASKEELKPAESFLIRHPLWSGLAGAVGGGVAGAAAGLGADIGLGIDPTSDKGVLIGAGGSIAGVLLGALAMNQMILRKVRQAREQFGEVEAAKLNKALREEAKGSPFWRAVGGGLVGTGSAYGGRVEQLASLKKGTPVKSGVTAGVGNVAGGVPWVGPAVRAGVQSVMGGFSPSVARQALA
jgi:hypothetical protein